MELHHQTPKPQLNEAIIVEGLLSADVLLLMLKGAGYAAVVCLVIWFLIAAMFWIGKLLPDESRETEDPTPFSYHVIETETATV